MGKGEIARNEQFLLFPRCFQFDQITVSPFVHICDIISLFAVELEESKIGISGKGLTAKVISWRSVTHLYVSWISNTSTDKTFFFH